ncbi:putative membrane protein [Smittium culicis]|uniref:Putative membrane protein n=1 Tax=Smittium culicis TaxID=133412 RepID=A0A1R1YAB9_9FUNG|nr:putative membrane protein [Smittium culicis]
MNTASISNCVILEEINEVHEEEITSFEEELVPVPWNKFVKRSGFGNTPGEIGSVSVLLFGLTNNFYVALVLRAISGSISGNSSVIKSVMGEISHTSNRATIFAFLPLGWNVGIMIGPMIGGFLYNPTTKYPSLFKGIYLLEKYPHFLPCLISCILYVCGSIFAFYMLEETLDYNKKNIFTERITSDDVQSTTYSSIESYRAILKLPDDSLNKIKTVGGDLKAKKQKLDANNVGIKISLSEPTSSIISLPSYETTSIPRKKFGSSQLSGLCTCDSDQSSLRGEMTSRFSSTMVTVILTTSTMTLAFSMFDSLFSIWSASDVDTGGLKFSTEDISVALGIPGILVFYLQLVAYPIYDRKYGTLNCYLYGLLIVTPTSLMIPVISFFAKSSQDTLRIPFIQWLDISVLGINIYKTLMWITLMTMLCIRVYGGVLSLTSINLMITNATLKSSDLGLMNGIQQLVSSIARFIGPIFAGFIWKYSSRNACYRQDLFL